MRLIREITAEEENFRMEPWLEGDGVRVDVIKRDPVEPEPVGTLVLLPFKIVGYDKDSDGSLMARLENICSYEDKLEDNGWEVKEIGLYPTSGFVVTEKELLQLHARSRILKPSSIKTIEDVRIYVKFNENYFSAIFEEMLQDMDEFGEEYEIENFINEAENAIARGKVDLEDF